MNRNHVDIDKYRTEFECDEHWELRKKFLLAHRDKFSEEELVCLAQTFTNIEFLGCRYPDKTMKKVALLASGIVDEYREKQKGRLQRTFVAASDAAGAKVKGLKRPQTDTPSPVPEKNAKFGEEQRSAPVVDLTEEDTPPTKARVLYGPSIRSLVSEKAPPPSSRYGGVRTYHITKESAPVKVELRKTPFGNLVLVESENQTAGNIIERSVAVCNIGYSFQTETIPGNKVRVKLYINDILVSQSDDSTVKGAREMAARVGLEKLREACYTIKIKHKFLSETTVDKSLCQTQGQGLEAADVDTPLSDDNVGSKLLRMMGWSGGGLGRNAQGIAEPISVQQETVRRAGFGMGQGSGSFTSAQFRQQAQGLLQDYASRDTGHDLVFTSEFTAEERKLLHQLAHKLQLKTRSYGKDQDRHLVVSKKVSFWEEANKLLSTGGSSDKYELIPPQIVI